MPKLFCSSVMLESHILYYFGRACDITTFYIRLVAVAEVSEFAENTTWVGS